MRNLLINSENAMSVFRNCLIVTVQAELYEETLWPLRTDILARIQANKVRGMILDLCAVRVLDSFAFNFLADTARMASLLGVASVFVGLQPGVVSLLVDLDVEIAGIRTALTTEDGFELLRKVLGSDGDLQDAQTSEDITTGDDMQEDAAEES